MAFLGSVADAANMATIAAESQQQVAVGFKDDPARGRQDVNLRAAHVAKGTPRGLSRAPALMGFLAIQQRIEFSHQSSADRSYPRTSAGECAQGLAGSACARACLLRGAPVFVVALGALGG